MVTFFKKLPGFEQLPGVNLTVARSLSICRGSAASACADSWLFRQVGQRGLVQLEQLSVPNLFATLRSGLLDIRHA